MTDEQKKLVRHYEMGSTEDSFPDPECYTQTRVDIGCFVLSPLRESGDRYIPADTVVLVYSVDAVGDIKEVYRYVPPGASVRPIASTVYVGQLHEKNLDPNRNLVYFVHISGGSFVKFYGKLRFEDPVL